MSANGKTNGKLSFASEEELRQRLEAGHLLETPDQMSEEYVAGLKRILTVSADTELISAPSYYRAAQHAPTINAFVSAMAIIQDELGHANIAYRLLEDLGIAGRGNHDRRLCPPVETRASPTAASSDRSPNGDARWSFVHPRAGVVFPERARPANAVTEAPGFFTFSSRSISRNGVPRDRFYSFRLSRRSISKPLRMTPQEAPKC